MEIADKCCSQCLFSKNKIVSEQRKTQILKEIKKEQSFFVCHKSSAEGGQVCCRGFYEKMGDESQMVRIAGRLGILKFVPVEVKE